MSTIENKKPFNFSELVYAMSKTLSYISEVKHSEVIEYLDILLLKKTGPIEFQTWKLEDLFSLGFQWWDKEKTTLLIPLIFYDLIPHGTKLVDINGSEVVKGVDFMDIDQRFGLLAYGYNYFKENNVPNTNECGAV